MDWWYKGLNCTICYKTHYIYIMPWFSSPYQCLSQDLETGCLKLAVVKFLGVQIFKVDLNILISQP